ncbi:MULTISPECIES: hypothetical protein [unclassified Pseudonocardia]|nr:MULTISPECIES: hypothetical protein [unclassified Pseudonocardia]
MICPLIDELRSAREPTSEQVLEAAPVERVRAELEQSAGHGSAR